MGAALDVVQEAYAAFGRRDIAAIVNMVADEVDCECIAPATLPYAGRRQNPDEVADFFEALPKADEIHAVGGRFACVANYGPANSNAKQNVTHSPCSSYNLIRRV